MIIIIQQSVLNKFFFLFTLAVSLFVLRFYGPVNPMGSCRARSVYLTTRLLGRLSPLSINQYCAHSFARNWQLPFFNQRKGENDRRKYFMINLHERMLPTSAGVEPATSWSPVGRRIQLSHRGRHTCSECYGEIQQTTDWYFSYFPQNIRWQTFHANFLLWDDLHEMSNPTFRENQEKYFKMSSAGNFAQHAKH